MLEAIARADLDALLRDVAEGYRAGSLDVLAARDPAWRDELERAEREVGALFQALCEADAALVEWRRAVADLARVWRRVLDAPEDAGREAVPRRMRDIA
jgi:uncharacterized damage-inducible protein DinB